MNISTSDILLIVQTFSLVASIILILMQQRGASLSSVFGGSNDVYLTRRGIEKSVVNLTVFFIVVFVIARIAGLFFA